MESKFSPENGTIIPDTGMRFENEEAALIKTGPNGELLSMSLLTATLKHDEATNAARLSLELNGEQYQLDNPAKLELARRNPFMLTP